ncbi:MAG: iron-sulfur cluster repair di-iron protein [Acidobacteria bacterium]|nr:iron-sulfur cluster repair di-iron protein [Acidobacteriota bacterium]MCG3193640.1 Iron-sulfur cluster repair protein YtfE [Thermoanaerobaculia bacterium]
METSITPNATLAELAVSHAAASRVFRNHGLDYCCHGGRPVSVACAERGLDPEKVLAEIVAEGGNQSPAEQGTDQPLPEVISRLLEWYHPRLREELPLLIELARKVEGRHAEKTTCPRGLTSHLQGLTAELLDHLEKEETTLFPMILSGRGNHAAATVQALEREHLDVATGLTRTRTLTDNFQPPEEACPTWRALYLRLDAFEAELMEHVHLENHILFRRALCA